MKNRLAVILGAVSLALVVAVPRLHPQEEQTPSADEMKKSAPKVYIDGTGIDLNYIRTEITFVNYVRDRKEADVHVLITQQRTGGGGREYTLAFIGLNGYSDLKNHLKYYTNRTETDDEIRQGLVQILKLGLAPYAARTPISKLLFLNLSGKMKPTSVVDKWDFWVFSLSARGRMSGEEASKYEALYGNVSINRVTPRSRIRMGFSTSFDENRYDYIDYVDTSSTRSSSFDGLFLEGLGEHWSAGAVVNAYHSTYSNIDLGFAVAPAVEYSFFPYSVSTRRQLRALYRVGYNYARYLEETIFDRRSDSLMSQVLSVTLSMNEPWGWTEISVDGSNYFNNLKYNRVRFSASLSLRIWKGLALTVDGRYTALNDQIQLRKSEATVEDLLLRRTELATSYSYGLSIGFSYTFGSVYSNVVNPRFGGGFGGIMGGIANYGY